MTTVTICLGLAVLGRFVLGTDEEIHDYYGTLEWSFGFLFLGFFFYVKKVPESIPFFRKYKFVQIYLGSHGFWHIFTAMNGYYMFCLLYGFNMHIEKYLDKVEPGSPQAEEMLH